MSTIVYRDGIMAADSRGYTKGATPIGAKLKVWDVAGVGLIGITTFRPGLGELLVRWMRDGKQRDQAPGGELAFEMLHVTPGGEVFYYHDNLEPSGPIIADYYAVGSGSEYALGAMAMGATAVQAVQAACMHDIWSTGPVYQAGNVTTLQQENVE